VTFSGVVNVFVTYPADRSVNLDASGNASALGTPVSATLTNATGLPVATGISGLGSGVATFLATPSSANLAAAVTDETGTGSAVFATSPTLVTPALGTPSALVGTNITGTAAGLTAGNVTTNANLTGAITSTGNATLLGSFSSANLAGALTDETGTGSAVFANSPTLVTPALGTPASGVVTNLTGTASININGTVGATTATTGAFTTLAASGDVTLSGGTANGVAYLNGSKVVTSGSALTYNGTDITFSGNLFGAVGSGYWVSGAGSYNAGIYGDASAGTSLRFQANGSEQMRLTSTGLGIGTSSPSASIKLHLNYDSVNQRAIRLQDTNGSFDFITSGGSDNHSFGIYDDTNGAYRLFITSGGNLGIGTSSPATKLDVLSPVSATPVTNGVARIVTTGANPATGSGGGLLFAQQASSTAYTNYASITGVRVNNAGDDKVDLAISTGSPGDGIAIAERIRVKTTGEVGVGTTTPQFKLDVINNATYQLRLATGTGQNYVSGGLYLGAIDTSDPFYYGYMRWDQTDISLKIGSQHGNNTGGIVFLTGNGNGAQTERARFTNVGNFGVGTSAPSAIIQSYSTNLGDGGGLKIQNGGAGGATYAIWPTATVNGEGAGKLIISGPSGNAVTIDSAGNFGLGITTPVSYNTGARIIQSHNAGGGSSEVKLTNATTGTTRTAGFLLLQSGLDTYVWNGSNSFMAFGTNDSERARIDNIGNLLVGTTGSDTAAASVIIERSGTTASTGAYFVIKNQNGSQSTNGVLTPAGGILFSTYRDVRNPSYTAGITYEARGVSGTNTGAELIFRTAAGSGDNFANAGNSALPAERARINSSGQFLINTTGPLFGDERLAVNGISGGIGQAIYANGTSSIGLLLYSSIATGATAGKQISFVRNDGVEVGSITSNGSATLYNTTSDQRLKENIQDAAPASALIDALQVRQYDWKADGSHQRYGFVAQELVTVAPEAVHQPADPEEMMAVDYSKLVPMLVKEIQSLRARLAAANI
jgi:hypothetical protein